LSELRFYILNLLREDEINFQVGQLLSLSVPSALRLRHLGDDNMNTIQDIYKALLSFHVKSKSSI